MTNLTDQKYPTSEAGNEIIFMETGMTALFVKVSETVEIGVLD